MTDDDNLGFFIWMGDCGFAWGLYGAVAQDVSFDRHPAARGYPAFHGLCLDLREDELYLDVAGCLDAPL